MKKYLFLAAIVVALCLSYSRTLPFAFQWYYHRALVPAYKPTTEEILLLVFGCIATFVLIGTLITFFMDLRPNKNWQLTYRLGVIGSLIIIFSELLINGLLLADSLKNNSYGPTQVSLVFQYMLNLVFPIAVIVLLILSLMFGNRESSNTKQNQTF